jgi:hypothetical protein
MSYIENHHIEVGKMMWQNKIAKLNLEYKSKFGEGNFGDDTWRNIYLVNWGNHIDPEEFDHDYRCRSYNWRDLGHSPSWWRRDAMIHDCERNVGTTYLLPHNYIYAVLYKSAC